MVDRGRPATALLLILEMVSAIEAAEGRGAYPKELWGRLEAEAVCPTQSSFHQALYRARQGGLLDRDDLSGAHRITKAGRERMERA